MPCEAYIIKNWFIHFLQNRELTREKKRKGGKRREKREKDHENYSLNASCKAKLLVISFVLRPLPVLFSGILFKDCV